ncbi:MAG: hypothetical protein PHE70_08855 [Tepidanaerobacteraceae bacterium]|nr:hypothetical protein [Tepidanaerobacteraceae bacterium]
MAVDFTDLVVLIGTNPLPNYVVIKYFLQKNENLKRIWLIYSEKNEPIQSGTRELADNIEHEIKDEFEDELEKLGRSIEFKQVVLSNVGSAQEIMRNLKGSLDSDSLKESKVHLNYTGGTKSMAVHTYKYFYEIFKGKCSFSYLDGRDFRLKYDEGNIATDDLRKIVGISLDSLYRLHGCKPSGQQNNPDYQEAIEKFKEIIYEGKLKEFFNWKNKNIQRILCEKSDTKEKGPFSNQNKLFSDQDIEQLKKDTEEVIPEIFYKLLKTLPSKKAILNDGKQKDGMKFKIVDFLNGKWLELYVYDIITSGIENDKKLREMSDKGLIVIKNNQEIKRHNSVKPFEIDVMILNGYQVCGISCTTSSTQGECKNKGFEIMHRTKQMGGDEARSILITCLSDDIQNDENKTFEVFYEDLKDITGSASHKFLALGLKHLKPDILWKEIRRHIWGDA